MKIKLNKSILIKGQHFEAGVVHDVEDFEAQLLINQGRAKEALTESVAECLVPETSLPPAPPTGSKTKKIKSSVNTN
jgi:hypothetical protein